MCQVCIVKINIKVEARGIVKIGSKVEGQMFGMCQVCIVKTGIKVEVRCLECVRSALRR